MEKQEKLNRLLWKMRWLVLREARLGKDPRRYGLLIESGSYWSERIEISQALGDTGNRINKLKRQIRKK